PLDVIAVSVHTAGIGDERGDREGAFADRPELPLDGLHGLLRHPLLEPDSFRLLLALLGGRDRLAVLFRPEELPRPFEESLSGLGVRPLHAGAEEALLEAFHPRRDPPVPFLRGLGLRL